MKFMDVVFLKVDVDQCQLTAESCGIRAMPTFHFYHNKAKIDELRGADPGALENKIKELRAATHSTKTVPVDPKRASIGFTWSCVNQLKGNSAVVFMETSELLLKFANNIMGEPENPKYRSIRLGNKIFQNKLLPVEGAVECLFAMGFEESEDRLIFPSNCSLEALHTLRDTLEAMRDRSSGCGSTDHMCSTRDPETEPHQLHFAPAATVLQLQSLTSSAPLPGMTQSQAQFYAKLKSSSDHVMIYEDPDLQKRARSHLPVRELEQKAEEMSKASRDSGGKCVDVKDCLILVLLEWFKGFFQWMDKPECKSCRQVAVYHQRGVPTLEEQEWGVGVVEEYKCPTCSQQIRFPRYNHPAKLLETRCGRCGEWANCFTMFCRVLGFETRHVIDWTDHVWTEVYSESQSRWLHCDSCECACDKPLVYEAGWGKKLSYIIAFSKEEVFDVTWRYSANHEAVRMRRTQVSEQWLADVTMKMTQQLQSIIPEERQKLLQGRTFNELIELMTLKSATPDELQGRVSGSLAWRKIRGELGSSGRAKPYKPYVFEPSDNEIKRKRMRIRYSIAIDNYYRLTDDNLPSHSSPALEDWKSGTNGVESIFRKVEHDWKMAYLARNEGCQTGSVSWKVDVSESGLVIDTVDLVISSITFENGKVDWSIHGDDKEKQFIKLEGGESKQTLTRLRGAKTLTLTAQMSGGQGDNAWQHAQLFRQSITHTDEYPLDIDITLQ
ncbi:peptide-N(4)-(N-acetyl-beta-glucosaminyl)asparagine amidase isoform X2 [Nematostella vectensis]|nr:peptide-N(4)-(N-acetyl-beta-glucosaminyl)asparagine amidase isoform X2 [Nematostella vectensis]